MMRFPINKKSLFLPFILALLFLASAISFDVLFNRMNEPQRLLKGLTKRIHEKEQALTGFVDVWKNAPVDSLNTGQDILARLEEDFSRKGLLLLVYCHDSLCFWSSDAIPVSNRYDQALFSSRFIHLKSGWFLVEQQRVNDRQVIGLLMVMREFPYQNKHLPEGFHPSLRLPDGTTLTQEKNDLAVHSLNGQFLFSVVCKSPLQLNDRQDNLLFLLYFLFLVFLVTALLKTYQRLLPFIRSRLLMAVAFTLDVAIIRVVIFYFKIPHSVYDSDLFRPLYYGSSLLLPSLGDLLVNVFLLLFVAYAFFVSLRPAFHIARLKPMVRFALAVALLLISLTLFEGIIYILKGLILDSSLSLNLSNLFQLTYFSFLGFVVIAGLLLAFFLASYKLFTYIFLVTPTFQLYLIVLGSALAIFAFLCYLVSQPCHIPDLLFMLIYFLTLFLLKKKHVQIISFPGVTWLLLLFAVLSTYTLYRFNTFKEQEQRKWMAVKLSIERDKVSEYLFREIDQQLLNDSLVIAGLPLALTSDSAAARLISYVSDSYMEPFRAGYDIQFTFCDENQVLQVQPENYMVGCDEFFSEMINRIGKSTASDNLWFLDDGTDEINYLAVLRYHWPGLEKKAAIYMEIYSKYVPKVLGYPELLIDKKATVFTDLTNYSYAIYQDSNLVKSVGKVFYSIRQNEWGLAGEEFTFLTKDRYNHLIFRVDNTRMIMVSTERNPIWDIISPFSYLIIFFGLFTLIFLLFTNAPMRLRFAGASFKAKMQIASILIILVSFLVIGITTLVYIVNLNNKKNQDILSEKAHSVLIELEHKLSGESSLTPDMTPYLDGLLIKFSRVFFTDINLYGLDGNLLATSRREIFQEGLQSTRMNTLAYSRMIHYRQTFFLQNEYIGNYRYLSAYVPFMNTRSQVVAYLNLPYFARQSEQKQEISILLTAFINIYILLIALTIFIALFISGYVTRPLQLIREKMRQLQLGRPIEKIGWLGKDEIGALVHEYNRMTEELARSAELLAQSERESAWREMAKQVAHEIKNPLTPMKLSIQYLQKAWDDKAPDWDQRLKRFTGTIIQQIENLSLIASEFSDFAKMPQTNLETVRLNEVIENSISLFSNTQHIHFDTSGIPSEPCTVIADKTQMLRVFNNLIKNSVQAIPAGKKGMIQIRISKESGNYRIDVEDNGTGISAGQKSRIFSPSFTTKSGGMGLGLAIVRSIIQNNGGEIWFESEEGKGSTFSFRLPARV